MSFACAFRTSDIVSSGTRTLFSTSGSSATAIGVWLRYAHDTRVLGFDIGSGSNVLTFQRIFTADEAARAHWYGASLVTSENPDARGWLDGEEIANNNLSGAAAAGAPVSALVVGGATAFLGDIAEIFFWNRKQTNAEWATVDSYMTSEHGTG